MLQLFALIGLIALRLSLRRSVAVAAGLSISWMQRANYWQWSVNSFWTQFETAQFDFELRRFELRPENNGAFFDTPT